MPMMSTHALARAQPREQDVDAHVPVDLEDVGGADEEHDVVEQRLQLEVGVVREGARDALPEGAAR
jgi:hypothetical protein